MLTRWFSPAQPGQRPTLADHLLEHGLTPDELAAVKQLFQQQLSGQVVAWETTTVYIKAQ
jgi:hypothetical protein